MLSSLQMVAEYFSTDNIMYTYHTNCFFGMSSEKTYLTQNVLMDFVLNKLVLFFHSR